MNKIITHKIFIYSYVFCVGIATMALEISASRLLAPLLGSSLVIWSTLIGVILLSLAVGYIFGGKLADKIPKVEIILVISLLAGLWIAIIPFAMTPLINLLYTSWVNNIFRLTLIAFIGCVITLGPPTIGLGMVTPFVLRIVIKKIEVTGRTAGNLYAISSIGNILGVFLPALITIPYLGTWQTIEGIAALLIMISALGMGRWLILVIFLVLFLIGLKPDYPNMINNQIIFSKDSPYQNVRIEGNNDRHFLVTNEGGAVQSLYDNSSSYTGLYWDYFTPLLAYSQKSTKTPKVLILGAAGGTIAYQIKNHVSADQRPEITGVEIDPVVADIGKKYFYNRSYDKFVIADARQYLRQNNERYDYIITDAYSQQIYIPFYLSTQEFFLMTKKHLYRDGLFAINVNASSPTSPLLNSFAKTLRSVYANVYLVNLPNGGNYFLIAANQPLSKDILKQDDKYQKLGKVIVDNWHEYQINKHGIILSDNRAPVEMMTDMDIWRQLVSRIR